MKNRAESNIRVYYLINVVVLLAAGIIFFFRYCLTDIFQQVGTSKVVIVMFSVLIVHAVKAGRLFFALYGQGISGSLYLKTYCKVTPISMLFPVKTGDLFRMYCYGRIMGSTIKGIVTILLDRFMDTAGLITVIVMVIMVNGGSITAFMYFLLLFLFLLLVTYFAFPGIYKYWKKYILKADATSRKLSMLKTMDYIDHIYEEIAGVIKGRGIILYSLSIIAWIVEIGGIAVLNRLYGETPANIQIMQYLTSALTGSQGEELKQFIILSVVFMITVYVLIKLYESLFGKRTTV